MNSGDGGPRRQEAERWLGVAGKLLEARDFEGCKQFVEQSVSADPLVPGAEELVAAAEVLQSVKQHRINDHPDYYAVLGLDSSLPSSLEPAAVSLHYQRLSLLLLRDPPTPAFTDAAKLVADAWAVLSDPSSKALFDKELELSKPKPKPAPPSPPPPPPASSPPRKMPVKRAKSPTAAKPLKSVPPKGDSSAKLGKSVAKPSNFWTMCTTCCHVHQYGRLCEGQYLLCHSCRRPFFAAAMLEPPTIVPDTDMYYCTWGFFPLGFPGGPGYGGMYGLGSQFGSGSVPGAGPGLIPPKKGQESVKAIGSGSATVTPNSLSGKRGRGRPRKIQPSSSTPVTPGSRPVNVIGAGPVPGSQLDVISPKIGESAKDIVVGSGIGTPNSLSVKRGRGRPRKHQPSPATPAGYLATPAIPDSSLVDVPVVGNVPAVILPSMGHGSPPKDTGTSSVVVSPSSGSIPMKRGRGRPRKNEANSVSTSQKMVAKKRINANLKKVVVDMN